MAAFKKILAPTDFSPISVQAVREAVALAKQLGAEVQVLHVCPLLMYALNPEVVPDDPAFEQRLKKHLREELARTAESVRAPGVTVTTALVDGSPQHEIAKVAAQGGFDLVVMSTHGRTGLSHFTLGSVAERTVRTSSVPVLTIRGQEP